MGEGESRGYGGVQFLEKFDCRIPCFRCGSAAFIPAFLDPVGLICVVP